MELLTSSLIAIVALSHAGFLVLEIFLWDRPVGLRIFRMSPEQAAATKLLAMNQGLYNGFLAAGLTWGALLGPGGESIVLFFLTCVIFAGIFGQATVGGRIIWVQALPAGVAMALVLFG